MLSLAGREADRKAEEEELRHAEEKARLKKQLMAKAKKRRLDDGK